MSFSFSVGIHKIGNETSYLENWLLCLPCHLLTKGHRSAIFSNLDCGRTMSSSAGTAMSWVVAARRAHQQNSSLIALNNYLISRLNIKMLSLLRAQKTNDSPTSCYIPRNLCLSLPGSSTPHPSQIRRIESFLWHALSKNSPFCYFSRILKNAALWRTCWRPGPQNISIPGERESYFSGIT